MAEPQLTAIICFANEGDEVENTVADIRRTAGDAVDILLINDASTDGRDYETVADRYGCRYFLNESQIGPAHSRHKGLSWSHTENFILLDAHMRFYDPDWHKRVNAAIAETPDALFCTRSKPLRQGGVPSGAPSGEGASMIFLEESFAASLKPDWNIKPLSERGSAYVPCVLGGNYAGRKDFLMGIGGYKGLHRYGGEEPLISIKAWLAGGGCKVITDVEIGHIYRGPSGAPWTDMLRFQHFNKLATCAILMPEEQQEPYKALLKKAPSGQQAKDVFRSREAMVKQARAGFEKIRKHPFADYVALNEAFRAGAALSALD